MPHITTNKTTNAGKTQPLPDLAPLEELQSELAAVRTRIKRTDRLIDQVVYRLYGLTEEQIAVVEGFI